MRKILSMTEINRLYMKRLCELGVAKSEHRIHLRGALIDVVPDVMAKLSLANGARVLVSQFLKR